jgi:hypothetical protein
MAGRRRRREENMIRKIDPTGGPYRVESRVQRAGMRGWGVKKISFLAETLSKLRFFGIS